MIKFYLGWINRATRERAHNANPVGQDIADCWVATMNEEAPSFEHHAIPVADITAWENANG